MHKTVLLQEVIDGLAIKKGDIVVDATLGSGGHAEAISSRYKDSITLIALDADADSISRARARLAEHQVKFHEANFRDIGRVLDEESVTRADKFIFDLGWSTDQFELSGRGFSFRRDEPLLMTYRKSPGTEDLTAFEIVNSWDEDALTTLIRTFGEDRFAGKIARKIVEKRREGSIGTTQELAEVILEATPSWYHHRKIHPATKTFQALRIAANDELEVLKKGLATAFERLSSGGRIAVITFHSLEDRIVKNYFRELKSLEQAEIITKKPITASREETAENPRARSAKLRIIQKI